MIRVCVSSVGLLLTTGAIGETFRNAGFELAFDGNTGALVSLAFRGAKLFEAPRGSLSLDVRIGNRWLCGEGKLKPKLLASQWDSDAGRLVLRRKIGSWEAEEIFTFDVKSARIGRSLRLVFKGRGEKKIRHTMFCWPGLDISWDEGICWVPRGPGLKAKLGELHKLGGGYAIVQVAPNCSLLFTNDFRKETAWVAVLKKSKGKAKVDHGFSTLGFVEPGEVHEIGTAYLTVVEGDAEKALKAIWDWCDEIGMRVPADRPDWLYDSVLYSFHPGGAIGSNCLDLGGFEAARTQLLPHLKRLGLSHIWMLPLEEPSIYNPRDYYRFQQGLGAPEDFKRLVDKAHTLGMRVFIDIVPHGGTPLHGKYRGNPPDMLAYTEDGKTFDYWCFDFRHKGWQKYIARVAEHYVKTYGIDGYRIDAVHGSRTPNWNHKGKFAPMSSPYPRASLSVREGGLQMIRAIRGAVKRFKPDGAVLGEVEGAAYAAEADVVYDFATCYRFTHIRQKSPAEFAEYLRQWLHEQKYTDPRGALRLRYTESHDTVRSQGIYGVSLMRAFWAICCWLDGVPMLYHEQEIGHEAFVERVIAIRRLLPELERGETFFDIVKSETPGVFAFLRSDGKSASVVVANLNPEPVEAALSIPSGEIPPKGAKRWFIWNAMHDEWLPRSGTGLRHLKIRLDAHEATVLALRPKRMRMSLARGPEWKPAAARRKKVSISETEREVVVRAPAYSLTVDKATGLPATLFDAAGRALIEGSDFAFALPSAVKVAGADVAWRREDKAVVVESKIRLGPPKGKAVAPSVHLTFRCVPSHLVLESKLEGVETLQRAMLVLKLGKFDRWQVNSGEGLLDGWVVTRHTSGRRGTHGIYWRPQGTDVFWQSQMTPLDLTDGFVRLWKGGGEGVEFRFPNLLGDRLDNAMLLDKFAGKFGPHLALAWADEIPARAPNGADKAFKVAILPTPKAKVEPDTSLPKGVKVRHESLDWVVETDYYRVVLRRTGGTIRELWALKPKPRKLLDWCDLYSDKGFTPPKHERAHAYFGASWDGETGVRVWRDGDAVRMRFSGRLRGLHRFNLVHPGLWFYLDYTFTDAPGFRLTYGVRTDSGLANPDAFLALAMTNPEAARYKFSRAGRMLKQGYARTGKRRSGQTIGGKQPDEVILSDAGGREILALRNIETTAPFRNVFLHRPRFYLCWLDGPGSEIPARQWIETSMILALSKTRLSLPKPAWIGDVTHAESVIASPSFEASGLVSLRTGKDIGSGLPPALAPSWTIPRHGSITSEHAHTGLTCGKVEHRHTHTRCWCLFTQALPITFFRPGSTVRFGAWVKGEGIKRGEFSWKRGTVRLCIRTSSGKTRFIEVDDADSLVGTFDWRKVERTAKIPDQTVSIQFQAGLNGAPDGAIWIDDVFAEVVTEPRKK